MTTAVSKVNDEGRGADAIEQSDQPEGDEREAASDDTDHDSRTSCGDRPNQRSLRDPQPRSKIPSNVVGHFSPLGDRRPDFPAHLELQAERFRGPTVLVSFSSPRPSQIRCPFEPSSRPRRRPGSFRQTLVFTAMWVGVSTGRWIRPRPLTPSGGGAGPVFAARKTNTGARVTHNGSPLVGPGRAMNPSSGDPRPTPKLVRLPRASL